MAATITLMLEVSDDAAPARVLTDLRRLAADGVRGFSAGGSYASGNPQAGLVEVSRTASPAPAPAPAAPIEEADEEET